MAYCNDADLQKLRPDILDLGTPTWTDQIKIADAEIDRFLDTNWYRGVAQEHGLNWKEDDYAFDSNNLLNPDQVKIASVYLSLSLAYGALAKNSTDDGFSPQRDDYRKLFNTEIEAVVIYGMDYDWPNIGEEVATRRGPRRLVRG